MVQSIWLLMTGTSATAAVDVGLIPIREIDYLSLF
jgi:hypothetical protein